MNVVALRHRESVMVRLPMRTVNEKNARDPRWKKSARTAAHRQLTRWAVMPQVITWKLPARVLLIRVSPKGELDDDNLRFALSDVRDGIADAFQTDDSSRGGLAFDYDQRGTGKTETWTAEGWGVEILITRAS